VVSNFCHFVIYVPILLGKSYARIARACQHLSARHCVVRCILGGKGYLLEEHRISGLALQWEVNGWKHNLLSIVYVNSPLQSATLQHELQTFLTYSKAWVKKTVPCSFYCSVYICWRISTIFDTEYIEKICNTKVIDFLPHPHNVGALPWEKLISSFQLITHWFFL